MVFSFLRLCNIVSLSHSCFSFVFFFHADLLFTGLDDVLSRLEQVEQRPSRVVLPRLGDTTDTSGDESDAGEPRRRLRSKKTYKMKRAWGTGDVGRFFVTGPTDAATKLSHFYCRLCRKDVSVLTHGHHERSSGTSRAANTFRPINGCDWRRQAGKCLTMRETS